MTQNIAEDRRCFVSHAAGYLIDPESTFDRIVAGDAFRSRVLLLAALDFLGQALPSLAPAHQNYAGLVASMWRERELWKDMAWRKWGIEDEQMVYDRMQGHWKSLDDAIGCETKEVAQALLQEHFRYNAHRSIADRTIISQHRLS